MNLHKTLRVAMGPALIASSIVAISLIGGAAGTASATTLCNPAALPTHGTTDISFLEEMTATNETDLQAIIAAFNKSQTQVHVSDVNQSGGYEVAWDNYLSGTGGNQNVMMLDQYITQGVKDSGGFIPIADCVAASKYSTKSFEAKAIGAETIDNSLIGMPFSVSDPVLYYNENAFTAAKIKSPPTTLAQMATDAAALKKAGYKDGMTIAIDSWFPQVWQGLAGQDFVNNNNGRTGRATGVAFNDSTGLATLTDLQNIVKAGDATTNSTSGSNIDSVYANLFAMACAHNTKTDPCSAQAKSGMTFDTSAALGTIESYLKDPALTGGDKVGVSILPTVSTSGAGGLEPGGNALFIPSNQSAAQVAASWKFIQYLESPTVMAEWDADTGYLPVTTTAAKEKTLTAFWKKWPQFKAANTAAWKGATNDATEGPLLGEYYPVSQDIVNGMTPLLANSGPWPSPASIMSSIVATSNASIASYNSGL